MITFNPDEIFEMAEEIERSGSAFYKKAADQTSDQPGKKLFGELSEWELTHERAFHEMRTKLPAAQKAQSVPDPGNEVALYLRAFADGKVFDRNADPSQRLTGSETMDEILTTAIGLEKDSIVFYLGMREAVPEHRGKDKVESIIKEEMKHITMLTDKLSAS